MTIAVRSTDLYLLNLRTRMPFRYGIAAMTAVPHLFVRLELDVAGRRQVGVAADNLPPKWFTKDPATTYEDDLAAMFAVITAACDTAQQLGLAATPFDLWQHLYEVQQRWGTAHGHTPLLAGFGASLVERAVLDAFCRATGQPFAAAVCANTLGIRLGDIHPALAGHQPADFLPARPLTSIIARHTVGLTDPLTDDDIPPDERLHDGLPQSLVAAIQAYGLTHFKIKLGGDAAADAARLRRLAAILDAATPDYAFTLDGNEQYLALEPFQELWRALAADAALAPFLRHLIFVEQPLRRDVALSPALGRALPAWSAAPPIIIDESDAELSSLPTALAAGYAGTSHKNCKGIFKGIANACLLEQHRRANPGRQYLLSGEDLTNIGPVALPQDLAVLATLGVEHAERNGHHYFAGLGMLPEDLQTALLARQGDLYERGSQGAPTVRITHGAIATGSVVAAPFGVGIDFDPARFTPLAEWRFASLAASVSGRQD
jgi:L-alanine-DL-glutamate epimerase-like enolase superfamily enzyme